ncbi:MAG: type I DNA topoisomerase [candidate division KSB1 bacterium]|nr:type I DNA topoisomerase [candidate division KSB1 bacterium]
MKKSLVIVESVAKTKTINKFLGDRFRVMYSMGHVMDLPQRKLGVDLENGFEPHFVKIRKKEDIVKKLQQAAAESDVVYVATDPDREGEAIAWHLAQLLKRSNQNVKRILFNEITESAVKKAIENPLEIDQDKVEAQKARRVLDRLVGYQVSPILWSTLYRGLSAGRVQTVALRLICEREEEIEKFVPQEYWTITAELRDAEGEKFRSRLIRIDGKKAEIGNQIQAQAIIDDLKRQIFVVRRIEHKEVSRNPSPPFTTSTMQQEASKRLGFTAKRTMAVAQQLYEGVELGPEGSVGLITYMRTDSTRIAEEALRAVREYIASAYGTDYLPKEPRRFKVKAGAQDAHEAIRPTSMDREPRKIKKYLTPDQYKLYELIWNRFVASQMAAARFERVTIDIEAGEKPLYLFRTTGSVVLFRGYLQVWEEIRDAEEEGGEEAEEMAVPRRIREQEVLRLVDLVPEQHFTKPPARYSESSLVKELDTLGIGRPSTYALIISTLLDRRYVERSGRQLVPTQLGRLVNKILVEHFPDIFNVGFTARMEEQLDKIESGQENFLSVVKAFYGPFSQALQRMQNKADSLRASLTEDTSETCPVCGSALIIKWGRLGRFYACSRYPEECSFTKAADEDIVENGEVCDRCGRPMIVKVGRFGRFMACTGYPECKNTKPYSVGVPCPQQGCDGKLVEKRTRRGKLFYSCSNYPKCTFATWNKPVGIECPACGNPYLEERSSQQRGVYYVCPACKQEFDPETVQLDEAVGFGS